MKVLEKADKANRVMVSIFPILESGKKGRGSKSFTVLGATVDEVYTALVTLLKQIENKEVNK